MRFLNLMRLMGFVAVAVLLAGLPGIARAQLIAYEKCISQHATGQQGHCDTVIGDEAATQRLMGSRGIPLLWQCSKMAWDNPKYDRRWDVAWQQTPQGVVLTCYAPDTGVELASGLVSPQGATGKVSFTAYNNAQKSRLRREAENWPRPQDVSNPGGACVPTTLYSMLAAGLTPARTEFAEFLQTLRDKGWYSNDKGVAPWALSSLFEGAGMPVDGLSGDARAVFETVPKALDSGYLVATQVGDVRLLRNAAQLYKVPQAQGLDKVDPHLVRLVAVERDAYGAVRALAVFDPSLFFNGNEPYWVTPAELMKSFLTWRDLRGRSAGNGGALVFGADILVTKQQRLPAIPWH